MPHTAPYRFGVEIECIVPHENAAIFIDHLQNRGVNVGNDSSIQNQDGWHGLELRTPPHNLPELEYLLVEMYSLCHLYNADINDSCGLHVHASHPDFDINTNLNRLLGLWVAIEDVMFATQPESRLNSKYCQRRLASHVIAGFPKLPKEKQHMVRELGRSDRYYALNFASLSQHGTIECRLHAGTTNTDKIINWIKLLTAIYDYALYNYNAREVNKIFLMPTSNEKIEKVWKMINLSPNLSTYFNNRIDKFLLTRLAQQQEKAKEILAYNKKVAPEKKMIATLISKNNKIFSTAQVKAQHILDLANKECKTVQKETNLKQAAIQKMQKKLLREFSGDNFNGNINNLLNPWDNNNYDTAGYELNLNPYFMNPNLEGTD